MNKEIQRSYPHYKIKVHKKGNIVISQAYTKDFKVGAEVLVKMSINEEGKVEIDLEPL